MNEKLHGLLEQYIDEDQQGLRPELESPSDCDPETLAALHKAIGAYQEARDVLESPRGPKTSDPALDGGRFLPGSIVAGRYRIVALLGRGGMGEVYRAEDLKLGVTVALKFLSHRLHLARGVVDRFLAEVRLARQISHPNVCRVFDVGEVDGRHFFSMEYIDGEDMASLLRRIGRLPSEKAPQIARQLCLGLAAAHELGILHRDLKPANVMLDGRGRARITDFGLASLVGEIEGVAAAVGTPAYMAPEQLAGEEVSVQTDLYSLGLVLYELFTGRPAYRASSRSELLDRQHSSSPSRPSSHVDDMDPAAERAILQCLESDPRNRPSSALAVAAALPGGDPLAAVLAAGETPSPELVAQAGGVGALSRPLAWGLLAATVAFTAFFVMLQSRVHPISQTASRLSPVALAERARDVLAVLGHELPALDTLYGFEADEGYYSWLRKTEVSGPLDVRAPKEASAVLFWYLQGTAPLARAGTFGAAGLFSDHPAALPGMARMALSPEGALRYLVVATPESEEGAGPPMQVAPSALFAAIGIAESGMAETEPTWLPPIYVDGRRAWRQRGGPFEPPLRVEAGFLAGRPVAVRVVYPWSGTDDVPGAGFLYRLRRRAGSGLFVDLAVVWSLALMVVIVVGGALVARANLRAGRGDIAGATKIAAVIMGAKMLIWVLEAHHVADLRLETDFLVGGLGAALLVGAFTWLGYLALEPYFRKLWPDLLVSWSRLLEGRFRDPLVGRHLLVGCLANAFGISVVYAAHVWGHPRSAPFAAFSDNIGFGERLSVMFSDLPLGIGFCALLALLHALLGRRSWAQIGLVVVFGSLLTLIHSSVFPFPVWIPTALIGTANLTLVLLRGGILPFLLGISFGHFLTAFAISLDPSVWYFEESVLALGLFLAVAFWGFYHSLGGRPLFGGETRERVTR